MRCGALDDAALAGHDGLGLSEVSPARREGEIVACHVAAAGGGRHGYVGDLGAQCAPGWGSGTCLGDAGDGGVGVKQGGQIPAPRG